MHQIFLSSLFDTSAGYLSIAAPTVYGITFIFIYLLTLSNTDYYI
ncbi:hypothetical protein [Radiobacillus sp. PE A8.2]